jgi:Holliday junction resolvase
VGADPVLPWLSRIPAWAWGLPALLLLALGLRGGLRLARLVVARRTGRSRRLGRGGARRAVAILERAGYRILGTEVTREGVLEMDGVPEAYAVRADVLVERGGDVFVAEVKAGPESTSVRNRGTRRQLLEYAHVFGAEGVLLVDARRGHVHVVRFLPPA